MTEGDRLVIVADAVLRQSDRIILCEDVTKSELATVALAVKLRRSKPQVAFRAIVEGWSRTRIVQELY